MRRDAGAADLGRIQLAIEERPLRRSEASLAQGGARNVSATVSDLVRENHVEKADDPDAEAAR